MNIPACEIFSNGTAELARHKNGLYMQTELAK
jgi:small subunit ribosomal protein S29